MQYKYYGFTLIEVLIAMAIFALLSTMTFKALRSNIETQERIEKHSQELKEFQVVWTIMLMDMVNLARRPIRDSLGNIEAAFKFDNNGECPITFTRSGLQPGTNYSQSGMQRVAYCVEESELYRLVWPVLDRVDDTEPQKGLLMNHIINFQVEAEDPETDCVGTSPQEALPVGIVKLTIETKNGTFSRQINAADTC